MLSPLVLSMFLAGEAPPSPVDVRAALVELTVDANGTVRGCDTVESTGSKQIDSVACLLVTGKGTEIPQELMPEKGGASIKWKVRAAMVQFADGSSRLVTPPEQMMRNAFMRTYPAGQRGVILVEARDDRRGLLTCAIFAPRTISRFDSARCGRVLSADPVTDSAAGERRPALIWRNAVVAAGDL